MRLVGDRRLAGRYCTAIQNPEPQLINHDDEAVWFGLVPPVHPHCLGFARSRPLGDCLSGIPTRRVPQTSVIELIQGSSQVKGRGWWARRCTAPVRVCDRSGWLAVVDNLNVFEQFPVQVWELSGRQTSIVARVQIREIPDLQRPRPGRHLTAAERRAAGRGPHRMVL